LLLLAGIVLCTIIPSCSATDTDIALDAKATLNHRIQSLDLLVFVFLLALTVLTIWLFKHHRVSWLHETGLAVIYGLIVGAIIRYAGTANTLVHMQVEPQGTPTYSDKLPPDTLWFKYPVNQTNGTKLQEDIKTYAYVFRGQVHDVDENEIDLKATFDPEVFFNIILPPIIFYAGYSLKKKYFFRNLGAILTFAIVGTTLSAFLIGGFMYGCVKLMPKYLSSNLSFLDTLYFGALISPTDPLTILAIFNDLRVDVNLYALVLGESVLNDAVAIVLSGAIQNYGEHYSDTGEFETTAFLRSLSDFFSIFLLSLMIGAAMGCLTALRFNPRFNSYFHNTFVSFTLPYMTKFTRVRDFPLLESALFVLMSYSTFLLAEATELTGVVAVLFCGICQAHYTYNNLSEDSRQRTKQIFELLNFLAENFIFSYIGVSMFTFPKHHFDAGFIITAFICAALGRAVNVYPLSWLLNIKRKPKISPNFQHMLFFAGKSFLILSLPSASSEYVELFAGLRGAMSFALAIRNTVSDARQAMLTATSLIVIFTVVIQGGAANFLLNWLKIPVGVDDETEQLNNYQVHSVYNSMDNSHPQTSDGYLQDVENAGGGRGKMRMSGGTESNLDTPVDGPNGSLGGTSGRRRNSHEKAILARIWGSFDTKYMKPLLTHSRPTLLETLPVCCNPIARLLTTTQQLTQDGSEFRRVDSDSDICIDNDTGNNGLSQHDGGSGPGSGASVGRRNSLSRSIQLNDASNHFANELSLVTNNFM
ncbi:hypothetical protein KR038_004227, partial [Drosophila bunnanda]